MSEFWHHNPKIARIGFPFSAAEALSRGLTRSHLRREHLSRVSHGWYVRKEYLASRGEVGLLAHCGQLLHAIAPDAAVSHWTAAKVLRLPSRASATVHVTLSPRTNLPQRNEFTVHGRQLPESDVIEVAGVRVTTSERVYLDLTEHLRLHEAVALGDAALHLGLATRESLGT